MYFWNLNGLLNLWKQGKFTERNAYQYLVGSILVYQILNIVEEFCFPGKALSVSQTLFHPAQFLVALGIWAAITIIFLALLYSLFKANGGDEGVRFIEKLLSIGFVIFVRIETVLTPSYLLWSLIDTESAWRSRVIFMIAIALIISFFYTYNTLRRSLEELHSYRIPSQP